MFRGLQSNLNLSYLSSQILIFNLFQDVIEVDAETKEMLKMMDFQSIPGLQMTTNTRPGFSNRN